MAARLTEGTKPSTVLSNIVRLVNAARLREGGSLASPDVRLSELSRDLLSYLLMLNGTQASKAFEALWRSAPARAALVQTFLCALRVVADPRAIALGNADTSAASTAGIAERKLQKPAKPSSKADAVPGRASGVCEGANKALGCAAGILGRLFLFTLTSKDSNAPIHHCVNTQAAAAAMVEGLLRGDCLPLLSRVLASGTPGLATYAPDTPNAAIDGAHMLFTMVHSMLSVGMREPSTRSLVLSPQLPACSLIELWARMSAADESPAVSHNNSHHDEQQPPSTCDPETSLDLRFQQLLLSQHVHGLPHSAPHAMRGAMGMLLPALLRHLSDGGEPLHSVLSGPCLQYLVALQAVSQLHAADGGTLYGLPPAAVLLPEPAKAETPGSGGVGGTRQGQGQEQGQEQEQAALSCDVLARCVHFWESCVTGQPLVSLGPLRNRALVQLCMRLSRVALASLEGAEGTVAQSQAGQRGRSQQVEQQLQPQQGGQGGAEAGGKASGTPPPASGVAAVTLRRPLEAGKCASTALQSLHLAATVLRGREAHARMHASSSAGGDSCIDRTDGSSMIAPSCRSHMVGRCSVGEMATGTVGNDSANRSSVRSSGSGGGAGGGGTGAVCGMLDTPPTSTGRGGSPAGAGVPSAAPEPSADPRLRSRSFSRRWWPLAVEVVRAALRQPGEIDKETFKRCCSVLRVSAEVEKKDLSVEAAQAGDHLDLEETESRSDQPGRSASCCLASEDGRSGPVALSTIPPGLAAALSAGLLPALTAMVQTCGGKAAGPAGVVEAATTSLDTLSAAVRLSQVYHVAWGGELLWLLSHADAGQAVALLSALAKAALRLLSSAADSWTGFTVWPVPMLAVHFGCIFFILLSGLFPPKEMKRGSHTWVWPCGGDGRNLAAEAEAVAPPYWQMLRLASFVLHTWTPVLARMHDVAVRPRTQHEGRQPPDALLDDERMLAELLQRTLKGQLERCVLVAARACSAAWRRGDVRAVGSWRQLLQRNLRAERWVGEEVVAGWEAEGWWSGAAVQQQGAGQHRGVAAGAEGKELLQQGEEGQGQGKAGGSDTGGGEDEAWPCPLPLAPCDSVALLRMCS